MALIGMPGSQLAKTLGIRVHTPKGLVTVVQSSILANTRTPDFRLVFWQCLTLQCVLIVVGYVGRLRFAQCRSRSVSVRRRQSPLWQLMGYACHIHAFVHSTIVY